MKNTHNSNVGKKRIIHEYQNWDSIPELNLPELRSNNKLKLRGLLLLFGNEKNSLSFFTKCDLLWQAMSAEANLERYEDEGGQDAKWVEVLEVYNNNAFYFPTE